MIEVVCGVSEVAQLAIILAGFPSFAPAAATVWFNICKRMILVERRRQLPDLFMFGHLL